MNLANEALFTESLWDIRKRLDTEDPYISFAIYMVAEWCEEYKKAFSAMLDRYGDKIFFPSKNDFFLYYAPTKKPSTELRKKYGYKSSIPRTELEVDTRDRRVQYYTLRDEFHGKIAELVIPGSTDEVLDILEKTVIKERKENMEGLA